jgi:hypothetical protein
VGGIEHVNGTLYVADSREGEQKIREFDIGHDLYELPSDLINDDILFGYRYILRQSSSFPSPTKPSFLSYDADRNKFVVGTYVRCGGKLGVHSDSANCYDRPENIIAWIDKKHNGDNATIEDSCTSRHYFSEMQGAASAIVGNLTRIWVSSSYGPVGDSHLHVVRISPSSTLECRLDVQDITTFHFPPGLEDLHIEHTHRERNMWMATEFGPRMVFSTKLRLLL